MRRTRNIRGFSLIELLMTLAVSSLVIAGMASAFISQAKQYQAHAARRTSQSHGRQGLIFMEQALRRAGFGVDPWLAITPFDAYNAETNARTANYPDGISVLVRDPLWRRTVRAASTTTGQVGFLEPLEEPLREGQILLVLGCNASVSAYVTVGTTAPANQAFALLSAAGPTTQTPTTMPGARFHQQASLTNECLDNDRAVLMKIDRLSFYVDAFADRTGDPRAAWTPYLMYHPGVDIDNDGNVNRQDAVPLADNVEQLQFAYVLNASGTNTPVVRGVDPLVTTWPWGDGWDVVASRPSIDDSYTAASRLTDHPANIRQVRATLVTRGSTRDTSIPGNVLYTPTAAYASGDFPSGDLAWRQLENLDGALPAPFDPSVQGYIRNSIRLTVAPKNLLNRTQFIPIAAGGG